LKELRRSSISPLTEETRAALESALRYFREAAPKHTADEEESLFPRMRQKRDPNVEARALLCRAFTRVLEWTGKKHALFMPFDLIAL